MKCYVRKINYYETDQMKVVHHSNYFRYFEEARTFFLEELGFPYAKLEEEQLISPVVQISCRYKKPVLYGETVHILVRLVKLSGVRCRFVYEVADEETGELRAVGSSEHCFIDGTGKIVAMNRSCPEFFEAFRKEVEPYDEESFN